MKNYYILLSALSLASLSACKKSSSGSQTETQPDASVNVFVSATLHGANNSDTACYYLNGQRGLLTYGDTHAAANEIILSGKDLYVVGYQSSLGNILATMWKNGGSTPVYQDSANAVANAITVTPSGDTTYMVGYEYGTGGPVPVCWTDFLPQVLPTKGAGGRATGVFLSGKDLFISGYDSTSPYSIQACYWHNGMEVLMPSSGAISKAVALYVNGPDVYVVGNATTAALLTTAQFWHNSALTPLSGVDPSTPSTADAITMNGSDIYIAGTRNDGVQSLYWKNGTPTLFGDGHELIITGIAVDDNGNTFICGQGGTTGSQAEYWYNGRSVPLSGNDSGNTTATSIFLTKK